MAKILVIDDDSIIIQLLHTQLSEAGHTVVTAMDGMSGPMIAAREKPDVILLDFNMPAANGAKVHERLRGNSFTAATPVIFLTANKLDEVRMEVPEDPKVRFLAKPIDFAALQGSIAELLAS
ncbi:MAG: response regulator [Elusimicrobia bacterium]|nr:response regulator [Elusimicrobiota bacterium]